MDDDKERSAEEILQDMADLIDSFIVSIDNLSTSTKEDDQWIEEKDVS